MFLKGSFSAACAIAAAAVLQLPASAGESLRIGGTGAANEMVKSAGALFTAETGIAIELIPSLGTGGGNNAAADGVLDICVSARPLNAAERAKGLREAAGIRTPFGLVTSHRNPNGFKSAEIAQLYQSDKPLWADGSPIRIILRPTNESDTMVLGNMFPGMSAAIAKVRSRADLSVAATDQDNADMAERMPGSLVAATFTQIKMEKRNLRFVAIDGVAPSLEDFETGKYPFGKTMYLVLPAQDNPVAKRFLAFLRTPKGTAAIRESGGLLTAE